MKKHVDGLAEILTLPVQERIELARCAAFFDSLKLISDEARSRGIDPETIRFSTEAIKRLQDVTVAHSNNYAEAFGVSFPDESERESMSLAERDLLEATTLDDTESESEPSELDIRETFESVED